MYACEMLLLVKMSYKCFRDQSCSELQDRDIKTNALEYVKAWQMLL